MLTKCSTVRNDDNEMVCDPTSNNYTKYKKYKIHRTFTKATY